MNLQQIQYIVEVAKTGSISAAAKNLYMGQPNLSKSIKELEIETGIKIFQRTAKGAELTPEGATFVERAKPIMKQMEVLREVYEKPNKKSTFGIAAPRDGVIAEHVLSYFNSLDTSPDVIRYWETNPIDVIHKVTTEEAQLGFVRFAEEHMGYFMHLIVETQLEWRTVKKDEMVITVGKDHKFAGKKKVTWEELASCIEIVESDLYSMFPRKKNPHDAVKILQINDLAGIWCALKNCKNSFMWSVSVSEEMQEKNGIVQLAAPERREYRDITVYHKHSEELDAIHRILNHVKG